MLTVQMMIGSVEADLRNGSSQRRYHGYTVGAHRSDAAMGQANTSGVQRARVRGAESRTNAAGLRAARLAPCTFCTCFLENRSGDVLLSQVAVRNPTSTGSPTAICGTTRSS